MSHEFWAGFITAAVGWLVLSIAVGFAITAGFDRMGNGE
jgi:hypothetical protein